MEREELTHFLEKAMGGLRRNKKLSVEEGEERDEEGFTLKKLLLKTDREIPAYLALPEGEGPWPAVIALHQADLQYEVGKSEVMGLPVDGRDYNAENGSIPFGRELARRGFAVLAPDSICFEERHDPNVTPSEERLPGGDERFEATRALLHGSCIAKTMVEDVISCADYLSSLSFVKGIGAAGHSLGGMQAWMAAALDERLGAVVASCAMGSFPEILETRVYHCFLPYIPGLLERTDLPEVASLVAPRPMMMVSAVQDENFPKKAVERAYGVLEESYVKEGAEDSLELAWFEGGHHFDRKSWENAYLWLERWLKPPTSL